MCLETWRLFWYVKSHFQHLPSPWCLLYVQIFRLGFSFICGRWWRRWRCALRREATRPREIAGMNTMLGGRSGQWAVRKCLAIVEEPGRWSKPSLFALICIIYFFTLHLCLRFTYLRRNAWKTRRPEDNERFPSMIYHFSCPHSVSMDKPR